MDTVYIQLFLGAFSSVVGGVVSWIGWQFKKAEKNREEQERRRQEEHKEAERLRRAEIEAMREGILAILRDRLISITTKCEREGRARVYQVENVSHMYNAYATLGGNGMVMHMHERFKMLPVIGGSENAENNN